MRRACRSERATRECFTSPTISTLSREKSAPLAWRRVSMSSRPWVGCALRPSPALTRRVPGPARAASAATAPSTLWRTMNPRTPIASMVRSVSSAVSPLLVDEVEASKFSTSAPSRCAASWKLRRVRVDGSKNSVHTAMPASRLRAAAPSANRLGALEQRLQRRAGQALEGEQVVQWAGGGEAGSGFGHRLRTHEGRGAASRITARSAYRTPAGCHRRARPASARR